MIVLTHIGHGLPDYIETTLRQIREFNKETEIYFITNESNTKQKFFNELNVNTVISEELETDKIKSFSKALNNGWSDFWTNSATRILFIEEFLKTKNKPTIHFENDVLIYCDLENVLNKCVETFEKLALTQGGFDRFMTGMFYIKDYESLKLMTDYWLDILSSNKVHELTKKYKIDMIHEMSLFLIYYMEQGENFLSTLPTLPNSKYYSNFNSIFDPATYGQYVGGTPKAAGGAPPGYIDKNHYIGNFMMENMGKWKVYFSDRKPYLMFNDKEYVINNLHIHSKNLHLYESYTR
jgi:hypothetical protein